MRIFSFIPAIIWLIISIILLTLPANDLPNTGFFNLPNLDKVIHFVMFFLLTTLFSYPFFKIVHEQAVRFSIFKKVAIYVIFYGIVMEFVQKYFTLGRSFDLTDILFDAAGSLVGLLVITQFGLKKIGPNKNRGRNQN